MNLKNYPNQKINLYFLLSVLMFFILSISSYSQCNIGTRGWVLAQPTGCGTYNYSIGSGEVEAIDLEGEVTYQFNLTSASLNYVPGAPGWPNNRVFFGNGICINGASNGTSVTYKAPSTSRYNIGTNREVSYGYYWNGVSATLSYAPVQPGLPASISGLNNVCKGVAVTYSIASATNSKNYSWEYSVNGGGNWTTVTTTGSTSVSITWPTNPTGTLQGVVRVRSQNGPCFSGWRTYNVSVVDQPTAPTTAVKVANANVPRVCINQQVGIVSVSGGINQGCTIEYRYSINGGDQPGGTWSNASTTPPTGLSSSIKGANRIQIQARRTNCISSCNTSAWNTVATWDVDIIAPIVLTKNITVTLDPVTGSYTLDPLLVNNLSTDNCTIASYSVSPNTFNCSNTGNRSAGLANTVTLTVTDNAGNSASQTAIVTVKDVTPPTVITQDKTIVLDAAGLTSITVAEINNSSSDICGIASIAIKKKSQPDSTYSTSLSFNCSEEGQNIVVLKVIDVNGNVATREAVVTVEDREAPVIRVKDITLQLGANGTVALRPDMIDNGTTDNCNYTLFTIPSAFTCNDVGPNTVLVIGQDTGNNVRFESVVVTIVDVIKPTITAPADLTVNADASCGVSGLDLGAPITADNCSVATVVNNAPARFNAGVNTITWTVTDASGNSQTATQKITVNDVTVPTISAPSLTTVDADAVRCGLMISNNTFEVVFGDNCSNPVLTGKYANGTSVNPSDILPLGYTTITWKVTDGAGNSASTTQTINVVDTTSPTIPAIADLIVTLSSNSCSYTGLILTVPTNTDNCAVTSITNNHSATTYPLGTTVVAWRAIDAAGNITTVNQNVIVRDITNPTITCVSGSPITKSNTTGLCGYLVNGTEFDPTVSDNCASPVLTHNYSSWSNPNTLAGATFPIGTTTIVWTATDASGNTATCTTVVTVVDTEAPVIQNCPGNITVGTYSGCTSVPNWSAPTAIDNCGSSVTVVQTQGPSPLVANPPGTYTVEYKATDSALNSSYCTFTVTVVGSYAPVLIAPNNVATRNTDVNVCTWTAPAGSLKPIQAIGNCPLVLTWVVLNPNNTTTSGIDDVSAHPFKIGTSTVTYSLTADGSSAITASFTVTVADNQKPTITAPTNVILNLTSTCTASGVALGSPIFNDNCSGAIVTNDAPATYPLGVTTVTWTVTDAVGNTSTATQTVTVNDNQRPIITFAAGNTITKSTNSGKCEYVVAAAEFNPTVTDNCTIATFTHNYTNAASNSTLAGAIFPKGVTTVTWTATDVNGNSATYPITITVNDTEAPLFTNCITNQMLTIGKSTSTCGGLSTNWPVPQATDNCSTPTVTLISTPIPTQNNGTEYLPGIYEIKYRAADSSSNTSTCSFFVKVIDTTDPIIVCPQNVTYEVDANTCTWTSPAGSLTPIQAVGNCPKVSWEVLNPDGTRVDGTLDVSRYVFMKGDSEVTYSITDANNVTRTCSFTVTVTDSVKPTLVAPLDLNLNVTTSCTLSNVNLGSPLVSDNCTGVVVVNNAPATFPVGVTTVTWTATDSSGNVSTVLQLVTVKDVVLPTITFSGSSSITKNNTSGTCGYKVVGLGFNPTATDNCSVVSFTHDFAAWNNPNTLEGATFPIGTTAVVWTALDSYGNTKTYGQSITIIDVEVPVFVNCPNNQTITVGPSCTGGISWPTPVVQDNCSVTITQTGPTNGSTLVIGQSYPIQYTATDASGNTATCQFTIVVTDNTKPILHCPTNIVVQSDSNSCNWISPAASLTPIVSGKCPIAVTWTVINPGGVIITGTNDVSGVTFLAGLSAVTYKVTDTDGLSTECSFTVRVSDVRKPIITAPVDIAIALTTSCSAAAVNLGTPTTVDNCSVAAVTNNAPSQFPLGKTVVTWTVTDSSGNTATAIQNVTVSDTVAPVIACASSSNTITKNTSSGSCGYIVPDTSLDVTATENCDLVSLKHNYSSWTNPYSLKGAIFPIGTTTVVWTAIDAAGNSSTCTRAITVEDRETPVFVNCPTNQTFTIGSDSNCTDGTSWPIPVAQDNCSVTVTQIAGPTNASTLTAGTYSIRYEAKDAAGNVAYCGFTVIKTNSTTPSISCPGNLVVNSDPNVCTWKSPEGSLKPIAFARCPKLVTWSLTNPEGQIYSGVNDVSGTVFQPGVTNITYSIKDVDGVVVSCSFTVTVQDKTKPTLVAPADLNLEAILSCGIQNVSLGQPTASDKCGSVTVTNDAPLLFPVGRTIVTWTATDSSNNSSIVTQTVVVNEYQLPVITVANLTINANANCGATEVDLGVTTSDNCAVVKVVNNAPSFYPLGETVVKWTATDSNGNVGTASQTVRIVDVTAPVITTPAAMTVNASDCFANNLNIGTPVTSDNCSIATITNNAPVRFPLGNTTVTWTVTDASGNATTATQVITVVDTTLPVLVAPQAISVQANNSCYAFNVKLGTPTSSDNCALVSITNDAPNVFSLGITTVTWTATDSSGNIKTATQLVSVIDVTLPVIVAPTAITVAAAANCALANLDLGTPIVTDNCSVAAVTNNAPLIFPVGNTIVTWTVTDGSGNRKTATQLIKVVDLIAPTITAPADVVMHTNTNCTAANVILGLPVVADNCTVATVTNNAPAVYSVGVTTVTWTIKDASGNTATATQKVTIKDTEVPTITNLLDVVVNASSSCVAFNVSLGSPVIADNCSVATVTNTALAVYPLGTTIVKWTVTDSSGNVTTADQVVKVVDNILPKIVAPAPITIPLALACGVSSVDLGVPVVSDNCTVLSTTNNAPATFLIGTTTVTWTVTDASGNIATASQLITVVDTKAPTITAPNAITVVATSNCSGEGVDLGIPVVTDNCTVAAVTHDAPMIFPIGNTTVTWTVTDASGNSKTATQLVTVLDATAPTITAPTDLVIATNTNCTATNVTLGSPVTADNCTVATVTNNAPLVYNLGETIVTWTVTDASGNSTVAIQRVIVNDAVLPVIMAPIDITVNANTNCAAVNVALGTPTVSDNCSVSSVTNDAPSVYAIGTTTVTWTVKDASGNVVTATQIVTVKDISNPTIIAPRSITVVATEGCGVSTLNLGTPITADNCTVESVTNNAPAIFPLGNTTVTWTVTDASGNATTATQVITVVDTTLPVLVVPQAISVQANNACTAFNVALGTPIGSDNCVLTSITNDAPNVFSLGTTTVTWTATDSSGNTTTASQLVTVVDGTLPTIVAPGAITVDAISSCAVVNLDLGVPVTTDNCSVATITNNAPLSFPIGNTIVTWTVTDGSGNRKTATQLIKVVDVIAPTITAPADVVMSTNTNCAAANVILGLPVVADNCTVATVTNNAPAVYSVGVTTVTWTIKDASGNTATATQKVTIKDTEVPTITNLLDVVVNASSSCVAFNVSLGSPVIADNCSVATVTNTALAVYPLGTTIVTWTITDSNGNVTTADQVVKVVDNILPTIVAPATIIVPLTTNCSVSGLNLGTSVVSDNCSILSITNDAPATFQLGNTTVTWTVTDASGNKATATQLITVVDRTLPTIKAPSDLSITLDNVASVATGVVLGNPITADNCSIASVTNNAPLTYPVGITIVTWTIIDGSGNQATATQTVTVLDNTRPIIIAVPSNLIVDANSSCNAFNVDLGTLLTNDNVSVLSVTNNAPAIYPLGITTVIWTVKDDKGNISNAVQLVTVLDNSVPSIVAPTAITVSASASCGVSGLALGTPITFDNCTISRVTNNAPMVFPIGTTLVTWSVTDASGNSATAIQTIRVVDQIVPTINAPDNIVAPASANCTATGIVLGTPAVADNCTIASVTNNAPSMYPLGVTTITWIVTDGSGNTAIATQKVTVTDTVLPKITVPADVTVSANNNCVAYNVALGTPVVSDNCSIASVTNDALSVYTLGTTTVTWKIVDGSGNTATATQLVTVVDTKNPTIAAPVAITVAATESCGVAGLELGTPVTTDNCLIESITNDAPAIFPLGNTIVTWTVTDASGNRAKATQLIKVIDVTLPTIIAPANIVITIKTGVYATGIDLGDPITADNCSVATVTNNAPIQYPIGTTTVVWTAADTSGNKTTTRQTVTVLDGQNPVITSSSNRTVTTNNGCFAVNVDLGLPNAFDNVAVSSVTNNAPALFPLGKTTVTWTARDTAGNTLSDVQIVTVVDTELPSITAPAAVIVYADATSCTATNVVLEQAIAFDNCSIQSITNDAPLAFKLGNTIVTWTAMDGSGNKKSITQLVTVRDTTKPVVITKNLIVGLDVNGSASITANQIDNGSYDNCTVQSVTVAPSIFTCSNVGLNTVVLTVKDAAGNIATSTAKVTIVDYVNPVVNTKNITVQLDQFGQASITTAMINNGSRDNCGIATMELDRTQFACGDEGVNTVVLTVTDVNGNTAIASAKVTVINNYPDSNNDGIKDNCSPDDDKDGIADNVDNCITVFNPDQADNDKDGIGDLCDDDDDNDGVLDNLDNCPFTANPLQEDRDNNGVGDVCDTTTVNIAEAFTPNGDGVHDTWVIYNIENYTKSIVRVFNAWGDEVFFAKNYKNNWDGSYKNNSGPLPDGSYYYQIDLDGDGVKDKEGWIYITRL